MVRYGTVQYCTVRTGASAGPYILSSYLQTVAEAMPEGEPEIKGMNSSQSYEEYEKEMEAAEARNEMIQKFLLGAVVIAGGFALLKKFKKI